MSMFPFSSSILLVSMMARNKMCNAYFCEERVELFILPSLIRLHSKDFSTELSFNKILKFMDTLKHLRFMFDRVDPCKFVVVIDKSHIIFITSEGITSWPTTTLVSILSRLNYRLELQVIDRRSKSM